MSAFRFRPRRPRRLWLTVGTLAVVTTAVLFLVASASAVLPGSPSSFESGNDPTLGLGNMTVDTAGDTDWISVTGNPNYVHLTDAASTNTDDSFTPGQKQDTTCPAVQGHGNPPKDDFTDVASFTETASGGAHDGETYLYGATIRFAANGNASENIELKQSSTLCPGSATLTVRSAGDKLIAIDYKGGGNAVQFSVLTWVTSGACFVSSDVAPCWGATVVPLDPNVAEGGVNPTSLTAAQNPISGVPLVAGQFAEFGVNLALAGIIPAGSCKSFNQTVWESRSSGSSFVSSTKDVKIESKAINNCPNLSVVKVGSDGGSQAGAIFTLYNGPDTTGTVVGSCTVAADGTCSDPSFTGLPTGQYTIDETNTPAGYAKDPTLPFTFTLAQGQNLTLTFTDPAVLGAIKVTKTRKHAADGPGDHPHAGVSFTVNGVTKVTDANGEACFDGLAQTTYTVHETVPAGYSVDANDKQVTVDNAAKCTDSPYGGETVSFHNTPLTNITLSVDSQVDGGTASTIDCGGGATGSTGANGDGSVSRNDLPPGTYTCTVVVDP
jgi:Prealbumin-like fold domain